jgi:hypothetical protein
MISGKASAEELPALEVTLVSDTNLSYFRTFIPPEFQPGWKTRRLRSWSRIEGHGLRGARSRDRGAVAQLLSVFVAPAYRRQYIASHARRRTVWISARNTGSLRLQSLFADYGDEGGGVKECWTGSDSSRKSRRNDSSPTLSSLPTAGL